MATLLLMRHAKAVTDAGETIDHERSLNRRGREAAPSMARLLAEKGLVPDLILCSSARRTLETMALALGELPFEGSIRVTRALYLTGPEGYLEQIATAGKAERVLVIGHNPTIEELLGALCGVGQPVPTAAIANIEVRDFASLPSEPRGRLVDFWRPREVD
jgi:phosphohistidine phosphatase